MKTGIVSLEDHELSSQEQENIQHLINSLSVDAPLTATEYITVDDKDANDEMVTDDKLFLYFCLQKKKKMMMVKVAQCPPF